MEKHYVGSEIGQLRSVMLHRPNLSLKRLTPSNCQELLFDDVLSVEVRVSSVSPKLPVTPVLSMLMP